MNRILFVLSISMFLSGCGGYQPQPLFGREEIVVPVQTTEEQPAKENPDGTVDPNTPPVVVDPREAPYQEVRAAVFENQCLRCHNPTKAKGGVDLSSLAAIARKPGLVKWGAPEESLLFNVIVEGSMPPSGPLEEEMMQKVGLWIQDQKPE